MESRCIDRFPSMETTFVAAVSLERGSLPLVINSLRLFTLNLSAVAIVICRSFLNSPLSLHETLGQPVIHSDTGQLMTQKGGGGLLISGPGAGPHGVTHYCRCLCSSGNAVAVRMWAVIYPCSHSWSVFSSVREVPLFLARWVSAYGGERSRHNLSG